MLCSAAGVQSRAARSPLWQAARYTLPALPAVRAEPCQTPYGQKQGSQVHRPPSRGRGCPCPAAALPKTAVLAWLSGLHPSAVPSRWVSFPTSTNFSLSREDASSPDSSEKPLWRVDASLRTRKKLVSPLARSEAAPQRKGPWGDRIISNSLILRSLRAISETSSTNQICHPLDPGKMLPSN